TFPLCCQCNAHHQDLHSFPTRRSSDLSDEKEARRRQESVGEVLGDRLDGGGGDVPLVELGGRPADQVIGDGASSRAHISAVEVRSEEHTSELQSRRDLVCRLLLEKKKL